MAGDSDQGPGYVQAFRSEFSGSPKSGNRAHSATRVKDQGSVSVQGTDLSDFPGS